MSSVDSRLADTQQAFDSVAAAYDGPLGNNRLIQRMRRALWRTVEETFQPGARLLDLGCGTGLDAAHFAASGYRIVATDWSPRMVERTRRRIDESGLSSLVTVRTVGIHELDRLADARFDGIYSDLGPLNCVPDLPAVARACARLLVPGGRFVASVIGRRCPWEVLYYTLHRDIERARLRAALGSVPVTLNGHVVWTRYFTPTEFSRAFAGQFELNHYRGLGLFAPPPYLVRAYERYRPLLAPLGWLDDHLGALPRFRDAGDHFLIVMTRRGDDEVTC